MASIYLTTVILSFLICKIGKLIGLSRTTMYLAAWQSEYGIGVGWEKTWDLRWERWDCVSKEENKGGF